MLYATLCDRAICLIVEFVIAHAVDTACKIELQAEWNPPAQRETIAQAESAAARPQSGGGAGEGGSVLWGGGRA